MQVEQQVAKQTEQTTKDKEVLDADAYVLPQPISIRKILRFSTNSTDFKIDKRSCKRLLVAHIKCVWT